MPIASTKTTTIPGLAAPSNPDSIAYDLVVSAVLAPAGVTGNGNIRIQPYRAASDGTNPLAIGPKSFLLTAPDVFAAATADAAAGSMLLANLIAAADAYVQWKVTQLGK
jgi:hypothetical protein